MVSISSTQLVGLASGLTSLVSNNKIGTMPHTVHRDKIHYTKKAEIRESLEYLVLMPSRHCNERFIGAENLTGALSQKNQLLQFYADKSQRISDGVDPKSVDLLVPFKFNLSGPLTRHLLSAFYYARYNSWEATKNSATAFCRSVDIAASDVLLSALLTELAALVHVSYSQQIGNDVAEVQTAKIMEMRLGAQASNLFLSAYQMLSGQPGETESAGIVLARGIWNAWFDNNHSTLIHLLSFSAKRHVAQKQFEAAADDYVRMAWHRLRKQRVELSDVDFASKCFSYAVKCLGRVKSASAKSDGLNSLVAEISKISG